VAVPQCMWYSMQHSTFERNWGVKPPQPPDNSNAAEGHALGAGTRAAKDLEQHVVPQATWFNASNVDEEDGQRSPSDLHGTRHILAEYSVSSVLNFISPIHSNERPWHLAKHSATLARPSD
jgi:hypothetical protein